MYDEEYIQCRKSWIDSSKHELESEIVDQDRTKVHLIAL